ncbi:hypothetical protein RJ41_08010 [Alteromonas marina]|uniref:TIGR02646 family protein n=1 Tax=Alteromonas marina TaxID=203795 RepID=A0A0B3YBQ4_9ALTE|nr:retron system putative HNH endonuclease [Alteromonas marina]KHT54448.1 hypothetical protein RJ41_08010 [Alteromonas marina]
MYEIKKSPQPNSLTTYKYDPNASYSNLPADVKTEIKESLLDEQGQLCAYCMGAIKIDTMRIEHWASQTNNANLELDYSNMLACCQGNEGQNPSFYICDKRKADSDLKYNPSNPRHSILTRLSYDGQGQIKSLEVDFDKQLNVVLNLNETRLVKNRQSAKKVVNQLLNKNSGTRKKSTIQTLIQNLKKRNDKHSFTPYYGYLIYYLENKIR